MKSGEIQHFRYAVIRGVPSPDEDHRLFDQKGQSDGKQKLGNMAGLMNRAQAEAFHQGSDHPDQKRCDDQPGPETHEDADLIGEISAQHVERGVGKV